MVYPDSTPLSGEGEAIAWASTVGPTRTWAAQSDGLQGGDPVKAASAIVDAAGDGAGKGESDGVPALRVPLGADAVKAIRAKLAQVTADVDRGEPVATATAF
jgi:hypothetical protein